MCRGAFLSVYLDKRLYIGYNKIKYTKGGKSMKKSRKTRLIAAAFAATAGLTSCQMAYGPPPTNEVTSEAVTEYDPAKDDVQDVYGPPVTEAEETEEEYRPENDKVQLVYGPPESFEK